MRRFWSIFGILALTILLIFLFEDIGLIVGLACLLLYLLFTGIRVLNLAIALVLIAGLLPFLLEGMGISPSLILVTICLVGYAIHHSIKH